MANVIMGDLDGSLERIAFNVKDVSQIISRYRANMVFSDEDSGLYLEIDGNVCPVRDVKKEEEVRPYFIVLDSGEAFNVTNYQILFNVKELPNRLVSGVDVTGQQYLCKRYHTDKAEENTGAEISLREIDEKLTTGEITVEELQGLKTMIVKLKNGQFFEALTMEFSGRIKEIAQELIDFRKDIQQKIEPDIVEIASHHIPEASNQLEGINETLEKSTMKIMDINDKQMETANSQLAILKKFVSGNGNGKNDFQFWDRGGELVNAMSGLLGNLPEEAKEICEFIKPNMDDALLLFTQRGEPAKIKDLLNDPVATINELITDFGNGDENLAKLSNLGEDLRKMLDGYREDESKDEGNNRRAFSISEANEVLQQQMDMLKRIGDLSLSMIEPLSFQDLVGQRIQRIIKLVKTMEKRIEELIISFGIKIQRHKEDPDKSVEELNKDVEQYKIELKGPQKDGEGLEQSEIDQLLASL